MIPGQCWSVLCLLTSIKCLIHRDRVQITALQVFLGELSGECISVFLRRLGVARVCCKPGPVPGPSCLWARPSAFPALGNWEFFIMLLCCRLGNLSEFPCYSFCVAPSFLASEWPGGSLAWYLGAPGEHGVVRRYSVPTAAFLWLSAEPVWGCHAEGL